MAHRLTTASAHRDIDRHPRLFKFISLCPVVPTVAEMRWQSMSFNHGSRYFCRSLSNHAPMMNSPPIHPAPFSQPSTKTPLPSNPVRSALAGVSDHTGFDEDAVMAMWRAVVHGGGSMAQFDHAAFGGTGQWMRGGMTMVSDLFNTTLRDRVAGLCEQLARLLDQHPEWARTAGAVDRPVAGLPPRGAPDRTSDGPSLMRENLGLRNWWPRDLNNPASTGAQNGTRYAYFPEVRRLAIDREGEVRVFDTGDHLIGGVSQQQGSRDSLVFSSQHGVVDVMRLPEIGTAGHAAPAAAPTRVQSPAPVPAPAPTASPAPPNRATATDAHGSPPGAVVAPAPVAAGASPIHPLAAERSTGSGDHRLHHADALLATIDKLADLHQRGVLTAEEFTAKKAELLARL